MFGPLSWYITFVAAELENGNAGGDDDENFARREEERETAISKKKDLQEQLKVSYVFHISG